MPASRLRTRSLTLCAAALLGTGLVATEFPTIAPAAKSSVSQIRTVTLPYTMAAVIDESSTTIGIADSSLYSMSSADLNATLDKILSLIHI